MKSLVLAEKPSVGREIARVLGCNQKNKTYIEGSQYIVTWAMGHLVTLAEPEDYDAKYKTWKMEDLPILPTHMKLKVMKETSHQFKAISQLAKRNDIKELIIATDAGREGELVARWIMDVVHWKKPTKRLWISSQTDKAIREGFQKLKPGDDFRPLYQSAVCRAEADWLIGLNVTRALTSKYNAPLAAGRVQTPTLCMMIEREKEINNFKPVPYWTVQAHFGNFHAIWKSNPKQESRIFSEETAKSIETKAKNAKAEVVAVKRDTKAEHHPLAYDLTELQRDANSRYGFSAKHTSNVLQRLYEQHKLVTYPRTDSRYLSSDMTDTLKGRLSSIAVGPYGTLVRPLLKKELTITKRIVDDSKVTDHHAIIPTDQPLQLGDLSADERKLYDLIARRFISLFYPPYRYDLIQVEVKIGEESFHAKGRITQDAGWKEVYVQSGRSNLEEDQTEQALPDLAKGNTLPVQRMEVRKHLTEPPQRYSEAELLTKMEKHRLGTPATRADIIEKLLQTETIERQGNRLFPTQKGLQLADLVADELRSPELTAKWENELEQIAKGKGNAKAFLQEIRQQTAQLVSDINRSETQYKPHNLTGSKCPECKENLLEVKSKRGKTLICSNRECGYRRAAENPVLNKRCPQCRKKMELRTGKAGKFAQCKPCNVIEMLEDQKASKKKTNKREERNLLKQYSNNEGLGASLGDALKAALENKNDPS
ncbi:DNA topoisomerase III [Ammoniphilus sp. CFH 90114]|uniref:DNA topoisomerase III n=1 Tax=Ammoniphilus sp. CFH 90114 TaxID=2493665 RepID=UPI00100DF768|nr:DNA topoisomerase III [Ammoniphilus sp. CFH 90114]RXT06268.1 DNA topoisomerase III [Ammoniphilus sp. CFH 90114]